MSRLLLLVAHEVLVERILRSFDCLNFVVDIEQRELVQVCRQIR